MAPRTVDGLLVKSPALWERVPALWEQVVAQWPDADLTHWNYALVPTRC